MEKLGLLFSKPILVVLSGLMFSGVAFASSGAGSLIGDHTFSGSGTKVPDVAKVEETLPPSILGTSVQDPAQRVNQQIPQKQIVDDSPVTTSPPAPLDPIPNISNLNAFESASIPNTEPILSPNPSSTGSIRVSRDDTSEEESEVEDDRREQINQVIRSTEEDDHKD